MPGQVEAWIGLNSEADAGESNRGLSLFRVGCHDVAFEMEQGKWRRSG